MSLNCKTPEDVLRAIQDNDVRHVDLRFTDPRGKWQHTTQYVTTMDEDVFVDGIFFDGSSIAGWKDINESDMILMPDPTTAVMDPFMAENTMVLFCDVHEPSTGMAYERCPRSVAKKAEAYIQEAGIGDTAYFGPEAEFFVFDDARFDVSMNRTFYMLDSAEGPYNSGSKFDEGNPGHRPDVKGGYFPVPPVDSGHDMRSEMVSTMARDGPRHGEAPSRGGALPA